ncbi:MAG: gliding motility-associated ABC transporter substrate-binding protein GldG [Saprospiraceae bacterium]|nr:gliding motility-associated ABC transporter substrate-binding protein GldG [Saprospiraceae bacterium]
MQRPVQILLVLGILVFINIISAYFYSNIDLTEEKRFRLTSPTKKILHKVPDVIYARVLLEGNFPAGFKRLQNSTKELLNQFRSENAYISFGFENPNEGSIEEINKTREELKKGGLLPINLMIKSGTENKEQLIYPYAVFNYGERRIAVNLLENIPGYDQETNLNNSISQLEYKFANAIQKLLSNEKKNVVFVDGHGELSDEQTMSIQSVLNPFYNFGRINLDSAGFIRKEIDGIIIARPQTPFSEKDKFKLDQYLMNGGKILWLVDGMAMSLDSMNNTAEFIPQPLDVNLSDILYKYGVRIEPNLVLDLECSKIPQVIGQQGGKPQIELFPWYYFPLVSPRSDHPIVRNLDRIMFEFPSSIDTIRTANAIQKTALLESSEYSRYQLSPMRVGFDILRYKPDPSKFDKKHLPLAYLLEGVFSSNYENRVEESMLSGMKAIGQEFKSQSSPTKMIIASDGDLIKNLYDKETGKFAPLGYNKYEKTSYVGNKDFISNAIEYLTNDENIMAARTKQIKLRLLDKVKIEEDKLFWQSLNIGLPLLVLILLGIINFLYRKRKYASFNSQTNP